MPVIKSAKKKLRQDKKRTAHNELLSAQLKTALKKVKKKPSTELMQKVSMLADKAAKHHIIHKNKAGRIKASVSKVMPKSTDKAPASSPKTKKVKASK